jgi:radical SAM superfamily enzyme YgiQ (UPF0313 family)
VGQFFPPIGLLLVAQTLERAGYEVEVLDGNFQADYLDRLEARARERAGELVYVGFYLAFLQIADCLEAARRLAAAAPGVPLVAGGPFPSVFPDKTLSGGHFRACCVGEGAETSRRLADALAAGRGLEGIPNLSYLERGRVVHNPRGGRDVLEGPPVRYESFLDLEGYVQRFGMYLPREENPSIHRALPILTGLGCNYRCAFCQNSLLGHRHRSLAAETIVEEIEHYQREFRIDSFAFFDEDFFADKKRLFRFLDLVEEKGLRFKWGAQCRANYFNDRYLNPSTLARLEASGCVRLLLGVESGSLRVLKVLNKGITPSQCLRAARAAARSPISLAYSIMVNIPGETNRDLARTHELVHRMMRLKPNSSISAVHDYFALPGSPMSREQERLAGLDLEKDFTLEQIGSISMEEYNKRVNPQPPPDMERRLLLFLIRRRTRQRRFRWGAGLLPWAQNLLLASESLRRRLGFYRLAWENRLGLMAFLKRHGDA